MAVALGALFDPAFLLNGIAPRGTVEVRTSIAYGEGPRRTLDVYAPRGAREAPMIVFFYGGSWQRGSKQTYRFVAADLARRGFVVVVPDYTVYPQGVFPQFLEDGAQAVGWAQRHAHEYGGNTNLIFLMGHSAGAHIAAMLGFDARWLAPVGMDPRRDIAGLIGLAGPYDFLPIKDPVIKIIFSGGEPARTQPITFVTGGEPPMFLAVADKDTTVRPGNSERLARKLREKGSEVALEVYPRAGHLSLIGAFSPLLRVIGPVADHVTAFVRRVSDSRMTPSPVERRP